MRSVAVAFVVLFLAGCGGSSYGDRVFDPEALVGTRMAYAMSVDDRHYNIMVERKEGESTGATFTTPTGSASVEHVEHRKNESGEDILVFFADPTEDAIGHCKKSPIDNVKSAEGSFNGIHCDVDVGRYELQGPFEYALTYNAATTEVIHRSDR